MKYNLDNYSQYVFDYLEGLLSTEEAAEFAIFLAANPHIEAEIESIKNFPTVAEDGHCKDFSYLQKSLDQVQIKASNYEEFCIAELENDLSSLESQNLKRFLDANPVAQSKFDLLKKTKINPNTLIQYPNKSSLYRKETGVRIPPYHKIAIAASISLFLASSIFYMQSNVRSKKAQIVESRLHTNHPVGWQLEDPKTSMEYSTVVFETNIPLAALDTSEYIDRETIKLSVIESKYSRISNDFIAHTPSLSLPEKPNKTIDSKNSIFADELQKGEVFMKKARNMKLNDVLQLSISGINSLTEANLSLELADQEQKFKFRSDNFQLKRHSQSNSN